MMQSETIGKLIEALAKAQADITSITKDREVSIQPREGGRAYKFKYVTLDALIEHVRKPLTDNGLWFVQTFGMDDGLFLETTLLHSSGEWMSGRLPVPPAKSNQDLGSTITYLKRYSLAAMLGLSSEDDDDANTADGNTIEAVHDRAPRQAPRPSVSPKPPSKDAAAESARRFGNQLLVSLMKVRTPSEYDEVYTPDVRDKIAKLKSYDLELWTQVTDRVSAVLDKINPIGA